MSSSYDFKKYFASAKKVVQNKKFQNILVAILFLLVLFVGVNIRIQPIVNGNLIDKTTGDYTPLALDPYYFLRIAETLVENNGVLPEVDNMRYQALSPGWHYEILPKTVVATFKVMKIFDKNTSLNFADVLNPVIFFALGLILFFFLSSSLTKNKWVALTASALLSVIPPYLYRTLAGFSDHEGVGMFGLFAALLTFAIGIFYLEKKKTAKFKSGILGFVAGLATALSIMTWTGGAKFLFMILPLAFLIMWVINEKKPIWNYALFYSLWVIGTIIWSVLFGYPISNLIKGLMLSTTGILTLLTLGYSLAELAVKSCKKIPEKFKKNSKLTSVGLAIVIGGILYQIFVGDFFSTASRIISTVINPFGTSRVSLTVAENKQPYLTELIGQVGKVVFYSFLFGCLIIGGKIASGIKNKKLRPLFIGSFSFFIFGILFSRISSSSILNGENFISKALFFISFLSITISSIYIYRKSEWKIDAKWIFIASWMIPMLLAVRSAIRVFFAIVPFISLSASFALFEVGNWAKRSKDDIVKTLSIIAVIILSVALVLTFFGYYKTVKQQAAYQTPSYNSDWQNAMGWVRNNTGVGSVFVHWWDYGYWVQTGGNRPTVTDGGHANGYWDHLIGRYVLTTPYPETAKSFMSAHNVSYLLIDPTDIGKYSAYSSIGTGKDIDDRSAWISTFISDPKEVKETRDSITRIYRGGIAIPDDIYYTQDGKDIFLPARKAGIGAITIAFGSKDSAEGKSIVPTQPNGIYVYNGNQYNLPIRYLFADGKLIDYKTGVNATVYLYSNIINGQQVDSVGAAMYLSERVKDSLVAKLYLMDDPDNEYTELELVHSESAYPFPFYYGGFRGPIKIWNVHKDQMDNVIARGEFTSLSGEYGELDGLQFLR